MPAIVKPFTHISRLGLAVILTAGIGLGTGLSAEEQPTNQPQNVTLEQLGDDKVEAFAEAYQGVIDISKDYEPKYADAGDDAQKAQKLQQEATSKMVAVIKEKDLTVEEYSTIIRSMRGDEELRQAIYQHMGK